MNFWKAISALAVGAFSSCSFAAMEFKEAQITTLKNQVQHDPGSGAAPAKVNEKIGENSKVTTAASSMAELTFADTSISRLGANSLFSFQSKERLIKLDKGSILVNTPPGNGGATVDCGGVTGAVSGTTFMASRDGSGNVMFVMLEGSGVLKVTINSPGGAVSKEIRPGQAATVGGASIQAAAESGAGEKPASKPAPSIQVFDVDVKKIVETAPLIKEFKSELPSMEKIEKTIEKQQTAVREGKLEKLDVEVVAVKEDGDVLVGSPKVNPEDMKLVNRKEVPAGGLDIDTAAGPGVGDNAPRTAAVPPPPAEAPRPPLAGPAANVTGLIAGEADGGAVLPPTSMEIAVRPGSVTVSFDRKVLRDRVVNLAGFAGAGTSVTVPAGTSSVTINLNPAELFPGFPSETSLALKDFTITALSDGLAASASTAPFYSPTDIQAANPLRFLPSGPDNPADLAAFDAYFYFSDRLAEATGRPSAFFDPTAVLTLQDTLSGVAAPVELRLGQDISFFAAGQLTQTGSGPVNLAIPLARPNLAMYGDRVSLGNSAVWEGLFTGDPPLGSLNYRVLNQNPDYAFYFNPVPGPGTPVGYFDGNGDAYSKFNFPVWDDAGGILDGALSITLQPPTSLPGSWIVAAGENGFRFAGVDLHANQARVEFQSLGDLKMETARIANLGSGSVGEPTLRIDAKGTVQIGGTDASQQVRLEGAEVDTAAGMAPVAGSLAVIRSETALELRNLTIRSFDGTRLETTGVNSGRVLLSGSTVRDFKIKELTGMAVNADAKIQMMAVNDSGQLDGQMQLEGSLPVATKLASAIDSSVTGDLGNRAVHANEIDLAAKQVRLNSATLTAMNSITVRANTLLIQDSFMTVVRNHGMINLYVQTGLVNRNYGTMEAGMLNFAGTSTFQIGNVLNLTIANSADINNAITSGQMLETSSPQA
ncbi:MAG: hypothetical protein RLZZ112_476, partial [Verrucomicrobiota bacterium]